MNSNFYDIAEIQTWKIPDKSKPLSFFHINACSLNKDFGLEHLSKSANKVCDIVAVSETRVTSNTSRTSYINLKSYSFKFTSTDFTA